MTVLFGVYGKFFCGTLGSAARFMASHSSVVGCDIVLVFELRETSSLG